MGKEVEETKRDLHRLEEQLRLKEDAKKLETLRTQQTQAATGMAPVQATENWVYNTLINLIPTDLMPLAMQRMNQASMMQQQQQALQGMRGPAEAQQPATMFGAAPPLPPSQYNIASEMMSSGMESGLQTGYSTPLAGDLHGSQTAIAQQLEAERPTTK